MFMDPSAFEAEDIERELADAGLEPETKAAAVFTRQPVGVHDNHLARGSIRGGAVDCVPPSSDSSLGLSTSDNGHGYGNGGGGTASHGMLEPRALAQDHHRGDHPAPMYGRHSKGVGGGIRSKSRPQMAPPSSTPPQTNSPTQHSSSRGSFSELSGGARPESPYFGNGDSSDRGSCGRSGGEAKFGESTPEGMSPPPTGGASSRARVLAQQREIQRKRRQQALNAGGIRASDAASLSRGLVSGSPSVPNRASEGGGPMGGNRSPTPSTGARGDQEGGDGDEDSTYSFSPSVKQFSAPRKVEGDAYTSFNSKPRNFGERSSASEFDRRRSSGLGAGVLGSSDEDDVGDGVHGRRRGKKMAPDMGTSPQDDETSGSRSPMAGNIADSDLDRGHKPGQLRVETRRRSKGRPDDWDDRHRPASRTYKWERGSGDEGSEAGGESPYGNGGNGNHNNGNLGINQHHSNTWHSVGRESSPATTSELREHNSRSLERSSDHSHSRSRSSSHSRSRSSNRDNHDGNKSNSSTTRQRSSNGGAGGVVKSPPIGIPSYTARRSRTKSATGGSLSTHSNDGGGSGDEGRRRSSHHASSARGRRGDGGTRRKGRRSLEEDSRSGSGSDSASGEGEDEDEDEEGRRRSGSGDDSVGGHRKVRRGGRRRDDSESDNNNDSSRRRNSRKRSSRRHHRHRSRSFQSNDSDSDDRSYRSDRSRQNRSGRDESFSASPPRGRATNSSGDIIDGSGGGGNTRQSKDRRRSREEPQHDEQRLRRRSGDDREAYRTKGSNGRGNHHRDDDGDVGGGRGGRRGRGRSGEEKDRSDRHRDRSEDDSDDLSRGADGGGGSEGKRGDDKQGLKETRSGTRNGSGGDRELAPRDGVTADPASTGGRGDGNEMEFNMDAIDLSDMKKFLLSPCPRAAGTVQCYIRRNKTRANKLFPEYTLFMKEGDRFLMCSKKRPNNATSNYLVSMRAGDLDRGSPNFLGKLRANFVGTEFQVYDDGYNPREQAGAFGRSRSLGGGGSGSSTSGGPMREELGCVMYASNVLGSRGPRKMQVAIPSVSDDGVVTKWSELDGGRGSQVGGGSGSRAIERVKNRDYDGSLYMVNKPPRWNDQVGAYVLNFYGRVTMASVKNFQLVSTEDFDRIILQFGRVAKDEFTMDFQYPISPFQAFAITLSSFDSKIACD